MKVIYSKKPILEIEVKGTKYEVIPTSEFDPKLFGTGTVFSARSIDSEHEFLLHMDSFKYTGKYYQEVISYDKLKEHLKVDEESFMAFIIGQGSEVIEQFRPMDFLIETKIIGE